MKIQTIRERLLAGTMIGGVALAAVVALPVAGVLLSPTAAHAQDYTSGVLSGTVSDASGASVAGATVTATSAQGTVRTATTGSDGTFRMPALPVGAYSISISQSGYTTLTQRAAVNPGSSSYAFTLLAEGSGLRPLK